MAGSPGNYTIECRARDNFLNLSEPVTWEFGLDLPN
jgi:hypothetical protein